MPNAHKGLGLESMRERVEISGGAFRLESAPGRDDHLRLLAARRKGLKRTF